MVITSGDKNGGLPDGYRTYGVMIADAGRNCLPGHGFGDNMQSLGRNELQPLEAGAVRATDCLFVS